MRCAASSPNKTKKAKLNRKNYDAVSNKPVCRLRRVCVILCVEFRTCSLQHQKTNGKLVLFMPFLLVIRLMLVLSVLLKSFRHARLGPWRGGENALDQEVWARHDSESIERWLRWPWPIVVVFFVPPIAFWKRYFLKKSAYSWNPLTYPGTSNNGETSTASYTGNAIWKNICFYNWIYITHHSALFTLRQHHCSDTLQVTL